MPAPEVKGNVLRGAFIAESLRVGTVTEELDVRVRRISRLSVVQHTAAQPDVWTLLEFEADAERAEDLAQAFSAAVASPGWYVSFDTSVDVFVVFPGVVFRYERGDSGRHADAVRYALSAGVPLAQCDW